MKKFIAILLVCSLLTGASLLAQAETRIYELKHRTVSEMSSLISAVPGIRPQGSRDFNAIILTATPEVHDIVAGMIEKYDKPAPQFALRFFILKAHSDSQGPSQVPAAIEAIVQEVSEITRFDHFELIDAPTLRLTVGKNASVRGEASVLYTLSLNQHRMTSETNEGVLRVGEFFGRFRVHRANNSDGEPLYREASIHTSFSINNGERIVLGTSQLTGPGSDQHFAIIVVVEAEQL